MSASVRQYGNTANAMTVVLGSTPVSGNLLIAVCFHWSNSPAIQSGWTQIVNANGVTGDGYTLAYKYAGGAESTSQQAFLDGTAQFSFMWEIAGVTGTFATDVPANHPEMDKTANTTYGTTSFNTASTNRLLLVALGGEVSTGTTASAPVVTPPTGSGVSAPVVDNAGLLSNASAARHGSCWAAHQVIANSGTAISYSAVFAQNQTILARSAILELANAAGSGGSSARTLVFVIE